MIQTHTSNREKTTLKNVEQRDLWETEILRINRSFTSEQKGLGHLETGKDDVKRTEQLAAEYPIRLRRSMSNIFLGNS